MKHGSQYFRGRYVRFVSQTLFWTPVLVACASAWLLAGVPQMREVYLSIIEDADVTRGVLGLAAIALFCTFLYVWNQTLAGRRIDAIYPEHADIYFDRSIIEIRDLKAGLVALLPLLGLLIGLLILYDRVRFAHEDVDGVLRQLEDSTPPAMELLAQLQRLPSAVLYAAGAVSIAGMGLIGLLYSARDSAAARNGVLWSCYTIAGLSLSAPLVFPEPTLSFARLIGPLAGCSLVLITVAVLVRALVFVARIVGWVFLSAIATFLMSLTWLPASARRYAPTIGAAVVLLALLFASATRQVTAPEAKRTVAVPEKTATAAPQETEISHRFGEWLAHRKDRSDRYPVFIVAAQGGGIYAASAVASFLATMQDRCPQFAQHIFAVSAVSGGAIGASIFDAMMQGVPQSAADAQHGCVEVGTPRMAAKVKTIVLADHLTPLILELVPDTIGQSLAAILHGSVNFEDRAAMLERSFSRSFEASGGADTASTSNDRAQGLDAPYSAHWSPAGAAPALLLNATWVETGYRVAFSPFALRPISDGTLYGLAELKDAGGLALQDMSLIQSSSVSARFPVVLPSWTIVRNLTPRWSPNRWTFVDGGYADGSGVTTALDVFNAVKGRADEDKADLYMILLTNASAEPEFSKIGSNWVDDYFAPMWTVMRVRDLLGWRAVTQARSQLGDKVITLQLEHRAFPLPMGWKLSRTSNALIEFMSGRADGCRQVKSDTARGASRVQLAVTTLTSNSCQLRRLIGLLSQRS